MPLKNKAGVMSKKTTPVGEPTERTHAGLGLPLFRYLGGADQRYAMPRNCGWKIPALVAAVSSELGDIEVGPVEFDGMCEHRMCRKLGAKKCPASTAKTIRIRMNGESGIPDTSGWPPGHFYLGPGGVAPIGHQFYYAEYASMSIAGFNHRAANRKQRIGEKFLLYVASNCMPVREAAFDSFAAIGKVTAGGKCHGTQPPPSPTDRVAGGWDDPAITDSPRTNGFRYVLAMENNDFRGYVTEKLINAFLFGGVPIYWGTPEVFDLFNRDAFIYYNVSDPAPALAEVRALEADPRLYRAKLAAPMLDPNIWMTRRRELVQFVRSAVLSRRRVHFLAFGGADPEALAKSARKSRWFASVANWTTANLPARFRSTAALAAEAAVGSTAIWVAGAIALRLAALQVGEFLVYSSGDCTFNPEPAAAVRLREHLDDIRSSPHGIMSFSIPGSREAELTPDRVLNVFGAARGLPHTSDVRESPQLSTGLIVIQKGASSQMWLDRVSKLLRDDPSLFTGRPPGKAGPGGANTPGAGGRHTAGVYSMTLKEIGSVAVDPSRAGLANEPVKCAIQLQPVATRTPVNPVQVQEGSKATRCKAWCSGHRNKHTGQVTSLATKCKWGGAGGPCSQCPECHLYQMFLTA